MRSDGLACTLKSSTIGPYLGPAQALINMASDISDRVLKDVIGLLYMTG
tara:strand:+ start:8302 stop:8448 length:147 start_codon:yes stop_codon:yes gene_type:complete